MIRILLVCVACGRLLSSTDFTDKRISEVLGAPPALPLETRAGEIFDSAKLQHDVQALWRTGRVSDIQVEAVPEGDAVRITFHLKPKKTMRVRRIRMNPPTPGVRVELEPGTQLDPQEVHQVAAGVRNQLASSGYGDAKVEARLVPAGPEIGDLEIRIDKRRPVDVEKVTASGDLGVKEADVRHALRATRTKTVIPGLPGLWKGWRIAPGYTTDAVQSDLANLRSLYFRRGYFDADVRVGPVDFADGNADVSYDINAGRRYGIAALNGAVLPGGSVNPGDAVCRELFAERGAAEQTGVLDFSARLEIRGSGPGVEAGTEVTKGPAYRVRRIEFRGNHRVRDETLRRMLLLDEGAPLDQMLLRKSMARINRTGWFEPLTEGGVVLSTKPGSGFATVMISLKEKKIRNWYVSGPVGPMSVGGSLRAAVGSWLPTWGQGLLELSTYTLSLNLMLFAKPIGTLIPFLPNRRFLQILTIQRPLLPGQGPLSGFTISPQLGWQGMLAGYGASQTRNFFAGLLRSERSLTPDLLVTVAHDGHEGTMRCEPPRGASDRMKQVAGAAVNLMLSFSPF